MSNVASPSHEKTGSVPSSQTEGAALKSNTTIVIAGASGDLAKKKASPPSATLPPARRVVVEHDRLDRPDAMPLITEEPRLAIPPDASPTTFPALFGLYNNGFLPEGIRIIGYARTKMNKEEYHKRVTQYTKAPIPAMKKKLEEFLEICTYVSGQYDQDDGFEELEKEIKKAEETYTDKDSPKNRVFYMALPPSVFTTVASHFKKHNYSEGGVNRIIVEKPFGKDLESSREMQKGLKKDWKEEEIFRIDHYLGKEMVKNLLVLRFANVMLDASFNKNLISNVQITFKEPFGTEGRGGYFDEFGIIRDVMQNHLLQVLSILTMERPVSFSSEDIRDEKVKVLRYIPPIKPEDVILGQYVAGEKDGEKKPGYLDDDTVPKDSNCPTFAAAVVHINSPRWEGIPFIMKAGKALNEQKTEIRIQYKDVTQGIFAEITRNELVIRVQPGEAVYLKMNSKAPGLSMRTVPTEMDLTYKRRFSDLKIPEAYECVSRLFLLCLDPGIGELTCRRAEQGPHPRRVQGRSLELCARRRARHRLEDLHPAAPLDRRHVPPLPRCSLPLPYHWLTFVGKRQPEKKPKPEPYEYGSRGPASLAEFTQKTAGYVRSNAPYTWPSTSVL
ncbi:SPOSA6832_01670, partial [Sporobolomyces salmonicolor]